METGYVAPEHHHMPRPVSVYGGVAGTHHERTRSPSPCAKPEGPEPPALRRGIRPFVRTHRELAWCFRQRQRAVSIYAGQRSIYAGQQQQQLWILLFKTAEWTRPREQERAAAAHRSSGIPHGAYVVVTSSSTGQQQHLQLWILLFKTAEWNLPRGQEIAAPAHRELPTGILYGAYVEATSSSTGQQQHLQLWILLFKTAEWNLPRGQVNSCSSASQTAYVNPVRRVRRGDFQQHRPAAASVAVYPALQDGRVESSSRSSK
ncbi:uncharacterized protein LOC125942154 [Dermacentor silvarum]|uniref:uncharacterized protein LOC125942154 n=1 Tax=Dermacentor silvarum TaxID=543639 RepID=UPI002100B04C|nr:uncharacterized protein LOC125942154 [Dermacentor silvarum]